MIKGNHNNLIHSLINSPEQPLQSSKAVRQSYQPQTNPIFERLPSAISFKKTESASHDEN
jgi:hypothetical protein